MGVLILKSLWKKPKNYVKANHSRLYSESNQFSSNSPFNNDFEFRSSILSKFQFMNNNNNNIMMFVEYGACKFVEIK